MNNIIDLKTVKNHRQQTSKENINALTSSPSALTIATRITNRTVTALRLILSILWTPINFVLALDCFFQLVRAIYYWDNPNIHAGWTFTLHFSLYVTLILFIASNNKCRKNFSR